MRQAVVDQHLLFSCLDGWVARADVQNMGVPEIFREGRGGMGRVGGGRERERDSVRQEREREKERERENLHSTEGHNYITSTAANDLTVFCSYLLQYSAKT